MDPICHTLVGASLGASGLARKTRYGWPTLLIAANLPDIDGVSYFWGTAAYSFRRGITHGIVAMVVLPLLLALTLTALSRVLAKSDHGVSMRWLLTLAFVGVATHPALDWLNTYGMRWLMPFAGTWYYGDALFIVDLIVWLVLIAGLLVSRWVDARALRWYQRPALAALVVTAIYVGANFAITRAASNLTLASLHDDPPQRLLASPVPLNPLERAIVLEYPNEYRFATVRFGSRPRLAFEPGSIDKGMPTTLERARSTRDGGRFLGWARFPYSVVEHSDGVTTIRLADARYVRDIDNAPGGFGVVTVMLDQ